MIELGANVRDKVTQFEGIAIGRAEYLTSATMILIQPPLFNGAWQESRWIDEGRIEQVSPKKVSVAGFNARTSHDRLPPQQPDRG